ncbi:small nuclear ribonucleoprotein (macronuclear) [Tetrahymena thermophila SB210]|uniref:Small nuclear ribonucleoprotein E n=1 Tax=Tetrahymena thermophila (strain SB210) TaxID=312017 RepID=A4VCU1_TETTS|nr:small nuclear ribonucleoprotein [Tetrahymena thermophila SB210]EDK31351.2 small nuclear ribonucleoprotein [Tetrahymena thermophila SB210]|eukprot:XP_001471048.2 small nuclear ribonucleoprotein [Tetrahymena thermophila SB210]
MSKKQTKTITNPLTTIFGFLQKQVRVQIWLFENTEIKLEGKIIGFDEYMNMVLDETSEVDCKTNQKREIGRILLKGENITLIRNLDEVVM